VRASPSALTNLGHSPEHVGEASRTLVTLVLAA
jgi:hypothetical protein